MEPLNYNAGERTMQMQLARALVGTTWLCTAVHEIITVQHPVMPELVGTNDSCINNVGISMLKLVVGDTQGR